MTINPLVTFILGIFVCEILHYVRSVSRKDDITELKLKKHSEIKITHKLKTLEDLYDLYKANFSNKGEKTKGFDIDSEELRYEAIKWIQELDKGFLFNELISKTLLPSEYEVTAESQKERSILRKWIKHFFGIEESDLK